MRRIFATLLALVMVCSMFVLIPAAEGATNEKIEIQQVKKAPSIDGEISAGEYGSTSILSWSVEDGEVDGFNTGCYSITDDEDLQIDFYAAWTSDDLYLAWKVKTKYDFRLPAEKGDGYMYENCCVQFILTPGAPDNTKKVFQTGDWNGDYLEVGICQRDDGETYKVCWSQPNKANGALTTNDWEAVASRDEAKQETVYECRLPWGKSGLPTKGDGAQFGLTFAVGAQENYETVAHGLVEYCDAIVGGKNADNAAIVTLHGEEQQTSIEDELPPTKDSCPAAKLPAGLETSPITLDRINASVVSESCHIITDASTYKSMNTNWSTCLLLRPQKGVKDFEGWYTLLENVTGTGDTVSFENKIEKGDILVIVHSDGEDANAPSTIRRDYAKSLEAGTECYLMGVGVWKDGNPCWTASNAQLAVKADPATSLYGTWKGESEGIEMTITFNPDKSGVMVVAGIEASFEWSLDDNGKLVMNGEPDTASDWEVKVDDDGNSVLVLDGVDMAKLEPANLSKLNAALTSANLLPASKYTEESYAALQAAVAAAQELVESNPMNDKQDEVDAAAEAVQAAIDALVPVESTTSDEPTSSEDSSEATSSEATSSEPSDSEGGLPVGAIVGIIVGAVVVIAGVVVGIVLSKKKKA